MKYSVLKLIVCGIILLLAALSQLRWSHKKTSRIHVTKVRRNNIRTSNQHDVVVSTNNNINKKNSQGGVNVKNEINSILNNFENMENKKKMSRAIKLLYPNKDNVDIEEDNDKNDVKKEFDLKKDMAAVEDTFNDMGSIEDTTSEAFNDNSVGMEESSTSKAIIKNSEEKVNENKYFTAVSSPIKYKKVFFSKPSNGQVSQILKRRGWKQSNNPVKASILWFQKKQFIPWKELSKWHRPNHLKIERELGHKGRLLEHLLNYEQATKTTLPFLPRSFRTWLEEDRDQFLKTSRTLSNETWIVKIPHKDGGKGISMAPPNSPKLLGLKEELKPENYEGSNAEADELIIQHYVKDIMLFNGHKFDLRIYWAILSINPLVVVYRDGTLRVSLGSYNTRNFTDLKVHLTNAVMQKKSKFYMKNKEKTRVTFPEFKDYLNNQKEQYKSITNMPFHHIKCQVKKALKTIVLAYKDTLSISNPQLQVTENVFALLGADFMIDNKLNIWITELQSGPGLPKNTKAVAAVMQRMLPELMDLQLEIREKQEQGRNIFPLKSLKTFEYIYHPEYQFNEKC